MGLKDRRPREEACSLLLGMSVGAPQPVISTRPRASPPCCPAARGAGQKSLPVLQSRAGVSSWPFAEQLESSLYPRKPALTCCLRGACNLASSSAVPRAPNRWAPSGAKPTLLGKGFGSSVSRDAPASVLPPQPLLLHLLWMLQLCSTCSLQPPSTHQALPPTPQLSPSPVLLHRGETQRLFFCFYFFPLFFSFSPTSDTSGG